MSPCSDSEIASLPSVLGSSEKNFSNAALVDISSRFVAPVASSPDRPSSWSANRTTPGSSASGDR
jgi:hypothetical protein